MEGEPGHGPAMSKLDGVKPELAAKVQAIIAAMGELGFVMIVTDGLRTTAQQQALYAQGRTAPGAIVTQADGELHRSNHQARGGFGYAVDCCFVVDGKPSWNESLPWVLYGCMAETLGLTWGGGWKRPDRPHVEWPA